MKFIKKGRRTFYFSVKECWGRIGMSFLGSMFSAVTDTIKKGTNAVGITKSTGAAPVAPLPAPPPAAAGGGRRKKGRRGASRKKASRKNRRGSRKNRRNAY